MEQEGEVHPDTSAKSDKTSHDEFIKINEAYNILSKDHSRQQYDIDLKYHINPYKTTARPANKTAYYHNDSMWHNMRYDESRENYRYSNEEYYKNSENIHSNRERIVSIRWLIFFYGSLIQVTAIMLGLVLHRAKSLSDTERYRIKYGRGLRCTEDKKYLTFSENQ